MWHFWVLLQNLSHSQRAPKPCRTEKLGFEVFVILGLDPRIHKETGRVLVVRWIAGSHPQGDVKGNDLHGRRAAGYQQCAPEAAVLRWDLSGRK